MIDTRTLGATFIIAGTSIGAGMLALPASTAIYGFWPTLLLLITMCICFAFTGLMTLEANLWFKPGSDLVNMARNTLGVAGQAITWLTYLLLMYAVSAAYLTGLAATTSDTLNRLIGIIVPHWAETAIIILIVASIVGWGSKQVDWFNRALILGLVASFATLLFLAIPEAGKYSLTYYSFNHYTFAIPIIATSFGYHLVIPSLRDYLQSNKTKLRFAIIAGCLITFSIYVIWELIIFTSLPMQGNNGLLAIHIAGNPQVELAHALMHTLNNTIVGTCFEYFAFFAIMTSFLGVSYGLHGLFSDSFKLKGKAQGQIINFFLTFGPPAMFAILYPAGFIIALRYAGVLVAILFAIIPVLMVWNGRYRKNIATGYRVLGGRPLMLYALLISIIVIIAQIIYS